MMLAAAVAGLLIGSLPTADLLARAWGVDLRNAGTGNPGTRNALELGGRSLAVTVLLVEVAKGASALVLGRMLASDPGGAMAGLLATAGNVYNPWFRFRGGKGLGISAGVILAAWPGMLVALLAVMIGAIVTFRRSGPASLVTFGVYLLGAVAGLFVTLTGGWGMTESWWLFLLALVSVALMTPKHLQDAIKPLGRPQSRR